MSVFEEYGSFKIYQQVVNLTTVNVLKFQTQYFILFWPKVCFYIVLSYNTLWNGKQCRP